MFTLNFGVKMEPSSAVSFHPKDASIKLETESFSTTSSFFSKEGEIISAIECPDKSENAVKDSVEASRATK